MPLDWSRADWRVSSRSTGTSGGSCVAVARIGDVIGVKDTKDPDSPVLEFRLTDEWPKFVQAIKDGEFDHL
ncbi:MAG: DUF397 domain-containing protein [Micromonosporaceae bacterium]